MISVDYEQVVYAGNGSQDAWPYSFPIYDGDVIRLILIDTDGTEINIEQDYFVDVPGSTVYYPGYAPGEEPPVADQPPKVQTGQKLIVYRDTEITQDSDLGDSWPFNVIEKGLDKLTMILQEKAFALARCLKISQGQAAEIDNYDPTVPLEAGKVLCGNADGDGFEARNAMLLSSGVWDGEGYKISNVADPEADTDAATKQYAENYADANFMKLDDGYWAGRSYPIRNVGGPAQTNDAATKGYVDGIIAGVVAAGNDVIVVDTVATMRATDLNAGMYVTVAGKSGVGDGGSRFYMIRASVGDVDDGEKIIVLDNGNVAEWVSQNDYIPYKSIDYSETISNSIFKSSHQAQIDFDAQKTVDADAGTLTIATFNVYTGTSPRVIGSLSYLPIFKQLATILMTNAQIIGLQEVNYSQTRFDATSVYSADSTYQDSIFGETLSNFQLSGYSIGNLIESTYTAISTNYGTYTVLPGYESNETRGWSNMVVSIGGNTVSVYVTHLDTDNTVALNQLSQLYTIVSADNSTYKIVVGDFNLYGSANYTAFTNNGYKVVTPFSDDYSANVIDHIIVSSNITALDVGVIPVNSITQAPDLGSNHNVAVSDHNPRWARLQFD